MSKPTPEGGTGPQVTKWGTWIIIAVVATVAGLLLPQMIPGEASAPKNALNAEKAEPTKPGYVAPALPDAPQFQGMILRLSIGTAIVLALCVATLWGMKKWMSSQATANATDRELQLKETLQLGNRCCLHLIHLGNREVLIGVDGTGIKSVLQLPGTFDEVLAEAIPADVEEAPLPLRRAG